MSKTWYEIKNQTETQADIYLYDEIGGYGIRSLDFIQELNQIKASTLNVHIDSPGGEVFQGFAIYQALRDYNGTVNMFIDGLAASIASVIAMAGDRVVMARNAEIMVHDGHVTMAGNASELTKMVETLDRVSNNIASVYAERTGSGTVENWRMVMKEETWFNADEALKAGLADEVVAASKREARNISELAIYNYAGRKFAPAPKMFDVIESEASTEINIDIDSLDNIIRKVYE